MQVNKMSDKSLSYGRYLSCVYNFDHKYSTKRLKDLGRKCDILIMEEKVPYYLRWLKGNFIFQVIVGDKHGNTEALQFATYAMRESITEKQLTENKSLITEIAVRFAKAMGYI